MDGKQKSVAAITQELQNCSEEALIALCSNLRTDPRKSVQLLAEKAMKRLEKEKKELERVQGMIDFEREIAGSTIYCGIDEAGRGPLAGPVVAAAVIMPRDGKIPYVNDSKQVSEKKREQLYEQILKEAVSYGVGIVDAKRIDEINILQATYEAMREAVSQLTLPLGHVLADAVRIPKLTVAQTPIIKGDAKCYSIAAASIIAKVTRDRIMREYDRIYPGYGFSDVYELKASDYLTKKGYQIIERNYRCRIGEIDIIAIERDCLCFIEVKYRKNEKTGDPLEAVDKRKQQKIIRTAQYYLLTHSKYQSVKCRFDAVGILGEEIRLVRDAFLC